MVKGKVCRTYVIKRDGWLLRKGFWETIREIRIGASIYAFPSSTKICNAGHVVRQKLLNFREIFINLSP